MVSKTHIAARRPRRLRFMRMKSENSRIRRKPGLRDYYIYVFIEIKFVPPLSWVIS
jgi:hypothetical protein